LNRAVDYYFAPFSPYAYLGHRRFVEIADEARATVRVRPMDLMAVFAATGGVPLAQRPVQRQAYRLADLERTAKADALPLNLHPKFFPVSGEAASRLIVTVEQQDGVDAALRLTGALLTAVWAQERDIAAPHTLADLLAECGLPAARLGQSDGPAVADRYAENTRDALAAQVFGSPSYVIDGEIFWGQDRLDFVQRALAASA
jgi:2-hydroxychromene-2-carboxylate isomerase